MEVDTALEALADLEVEVRNILPSSLDQYLEYSMQSLVEKWPQIKDEEKRQHMRMAARLLREKKKDIVWRVFDLVARGLVAPSYKDFQEIHYLRLMDHESLDLAQAKARINKNFYERAYAESARLENCLELLNINGFLINSKALGAEHIASSLQYVMTTLDIPNSVQFVIIDHFAENNGKFLLDFYTRLNRTLQKSGLRGRFLAYGRGDQRQLNMTPAQVAKRLKIHLLDALFEVDAVCATQALRDKLPALIEEYFNAEAQQNLNGQQLVELAKFEGDFLNLLVDADLGARSRVMLCQLVEPVFVQRMLDPAQFETPRNPVRVLVRMVREISHQDTMASVDDWQRIADVVAAISQSGGRSIADFENGLRQLEISAESGQQDSRLHEKTALENEQAAQICVAEALQKYTSDEHLDPSVREVLSRILVPWMRQCCVRHGNSSDEWFQACASVHLFFKASSAEKSRVENRARKRLREDVLAEVRMLGEQFELEQESLGAVLAALAHYFDRLNQVWVRRARVAEPADVQI